MQRPSRVDLVEQVKKAAGLKPGDKNDLKTLGYFSRNDLVELLAYIAKLKSELRGGAA